MPSPGHWSETSTPTESQSKPKPKRRSVSLLTPSQLRLKRANDREYQRRFRDRVQRNISELERKVEILTEENHLVKQENASLYQIAGGVTPMPTGVIQHPELDLRGVNSMDIAGQTRSDQIFHTGVQQSLFVWEVKPNYYSFATCAFDQVCLDLLATGEIDHLQKSALASSVKSLLVQVAIMNVMYAMTRWMKASSEEAYNKMPEWLRPRAGQIITAHPLWVDMIPWPRLRDRLCWDACYHNEAFQAESYHAISIRWPYESNVVLDNGMINSVFLEHIRTIENWTFDAEVLEKYPDLKGAANIGYVF